MTTARRRVPRSPAAGWWTPRRGRDESPKKKGFKPHLTLGRVRRKTRRSDVTQVGEVVAGTEVGQLAEVTADRFELIRSVLKPSGAEYTTLQTFTLGG